MTVFLCIVVVIMMFGIEEAFVCSILGGMFIDSIINNGVVFRRCFWG